VESGRVAWQGEGGCFPWDGPWELLADLPATSTVALRVCWALAGTWLGASSLYSVMFIILLERIALEKCQQMTWSPVNEERLLF